MKKPMLSFIALLLAASILVPVFAKQPPEYGLIKANKRKHIVRNYLYDGLTVSGWVTFICQSTEGFQYSVAVRDLDPTTMYTVRALSLAAAFAGLDPDGNPIFLLTSDGPGNYYPLGTISTNGEGEGEVTGLVSLPATHAILPFGLYAFEIQVLDSAGIVLVTISPDPIDFQVFPGWPP